MVKSTLTIHIMLYGLLLSAIIGFISFGFIFLESNLSHHIWGLLLGQSFFKPAIIFTFCLIGGLIVGGLRSKWGEYPQTAHHVITELKENKTLNYRHVFKNLSIALMILIFGAGVGPEAALLGAIVLLSVWQSDKLRYFIANQSMLKTLSPLNRLQKMLHPTKHLIPFNAKEQPPQWRALKKYVNALFVLNGLFAFTILMKLTSQPSFITKMGPTHWSFKEIWLILPLVLIGVAIGKSYTIFSKKMASWFDFWHESPVKKALIGAFAIFIIGVFMPNLLFSGQVALGAVPTSFTSYSVLILIAIVLAKLVFLQICLNTGWIGGDIFPIVFSAIILGFATSQVLPQFDTVLIVATVATAMCLSILNSPLVVALFVSLFFPIQIMPVILVIALLFMIIEKNKKTTEPVN